MDEGQEEQAVLVSETKVRDAEEREQIIHNISSAMHEHFGINVIIDLTRSGTLPKTSSGKLYRYQSKQGYLARRILLEVEGQSETQASGNPSIVSTP